jgi:pimeloyl-ACP methyl ester carboxylesterase
MRQLSLQNIPGGVADMFPFSILRPWLLGIFSWAILGMGIYCLWHWYDRAHPQVVVEEQRGDDEPRRRPIVAADDDDWPYLAAGIALVGWSLIGFLPITPLLGHPRFDEPKPARRGEVRKVDRPDGTQLHVEIYGRAGQPTLVFTHGWSLDSTAWYYAKKLLASTHRIVVWDLPGLGQSRGPRDNNYRLEKMAADLDAVIEAVSPQGQVFLVGHSIGGMIVQTYCRLFAAKLATRVAGIVLVHTTYKNPLRTALGASVWTALEKPLIVPLNYLTIALAPLAWLSNWQSYLNGSLHIASRISSFAGKQTWGQIDYSSRLYAKAWPGVLARGNLAMIEFNEEATLPQLDVPALVIAGRHDRLTKPEASETIDQLLPQGILTSVDGGHLGLWECNSDVCQAIEQFVEKFRPRLPGATLAPERSAGG